jgi:hypothetical protein
VNKSISIPQVILCLSFFLLSACVGTQGRLDPVESQVKLNPEVTSFIQLLVRLEEPTLAEYAKFSGECGGESELDFELEECRSKGWHTHSQSCINYTRQRCDMADQETSLELSWLRERFSTVGKSYRLISVHSETEFFKHDLVEVDIGKNKFLLFHNNALYQPGGMLVGVSKVNGKNLSDFR